jgi:hypothetical protein
MSALDASTAAAAAGEITFTHASSIDAHDAILVVGAAIFTSLLTEGKCLLGVNEGVYRDLVVLDLQAT